MEDRDRDHDRDDELEVRSERYYERREAIALGVIGLVVIVIAGIGTWVSRWDTVEFREVELVGDRLLSVGYQCNAPSRLDAEAFDDRVEILVTEQIPENNQDCYNARCVELAEPLGDRRVVNRGTGEDVVVRVSRDTIDGVLGACQAGVMRLPSP